MAKFKGEQQKIKVLKDHGEKTISPNIKNLRRND